jgi:biopolymer transport protein ExbD
MMGISRRSFTLADRRRILRRRRNEYICRIDVSPLLVLFFLFWLVLAIHPPHQYPGHGYGVDLPRSLHGQDLTEAQREDALFVTVSRDGRYFLNGTPYSLDDLADRVRAGVWRGAERKVYLAIDRRAKYGTVKLALAEVRWGGIKDIAILTYSY